MIRQRSTGDPRAPLDATPTEPDTGMENALRPPARSGPENARSTAKGNMTMPAYVILINFSRQADINEVPDRLDEVREAFRSMGGALDSFYLTMGQYDAVAFVEAPDDATMAKLLSMGIGAVGAVNTETLRAFSEDEWRGVHEG